MINAFSVINYVSDWMRFDLFNPEETHFAVVSIDGLGPVKANINTSTSATADGSTYISAKADSRNIVLNFIFIDDGSISIETLRQVSYRLFPIKKPVTLIFETDNRQAAIHGYVESNLPTIFSSQEGCQISIICPDPYFYRTGPNGTQITYFYGIEKMFEFPFSNESLDEKLIKMGELVTDHTKNVFYQGDTETGVLIAIHATGNVSGIEIYNITTRETMTIDDSVIETITGSGIVEGDTIYINTIKGSKYIRLLRHGYFYNILNAVGKDADWFQLVKGNNQFAFTVDSGEDYVTITITNNVLYEGL